MTKTKARVCTGLLALFVFTTLYISSGYAVRWYNTFRNIFSIFGEIMALWTFYRWLIEPVADPKHADIPVASGDSIPDGWINPFRVIKEAKKNGQNVAKTNGLSNAGNPTDRSKPVSGGTVELVRAGDGKSKVDASLAYSTPYWEPESGSPN